MDVGKDEVLLVVAVVGALTPIIGAFHATTLWLIKTGVRNAILNNNTVLIAQINGSYMKTELAMQRFDSLKDSMGELRQRITVLEQIYRESGDDD